MAQEIRNSILQFLDNHPRWSRLLLYTSFVLIALPLLTSIAYYVARVGRDDVRQTVYLQNKRFIVSLPTYVYYTSSKTYPISVSQPVTSSQTLTRTQMSITSIDGLLVTQSPSTTITFRPDQYQSFSLSVQHDLITHGFWYDVGGIGIRFEPSLPSDPGMITVTKETYMWSVIRSLFVIQSFTGGTFVLVAGFLSLALAALEQDRKRKNAEIEQKRQEANAKKVLSLLEEATIQGDSKKIREIRSQIDFKLLDSETQAHINSFSDEDLIKHFNMSKIPSDWQLAHLRFVLDKAQESAKAQELTDQQIQDIKKSLDQIEDPHIKADFLKTFFNLILKRRHHPSISIIGAEKGGGFREEAVLAEHDNPSFYYVCDDVDMAVEKRLKTSGIAAIAGPAGSGKTAYLRYRQASFDRGIACMVPMSDSTASTEQLEQKVSYEFTCQMFDLLCKHLYAWLWLEEPDQTILAWFFARYLVRSRDYLDSPIQRIKFALESTTGDASDRETDQSASESLVHAIQKASAIADSLEQVGSSSQSLSRYRLLDLSTVLHNLKRDQPYEVLVLIDNVPSQTDLLIAQKVLDCSLVSVQGLVQTPQVLDYSLDSVQGLVQTPQIIAAYSSDAPDADKDDNVTLRWSEEQLRHLIEYRQERVIKEGREEPETLIADTVLAHLINEIAVPRDIWPWWAALTYAREQRRWGTTDFLQVDWDLVAPPMQRAREQRRLHTPNGPNWTMDDWTEALNAIQHSSEVTHPQ